MEGEKTVPVQGLFLFITVCARGLLFIKMISYCPCVGKTSIQQVMGFSNNALSFLTGYSTVWSIPAGQRQSPHPR
jgi:hypothetical protein